MIKFWLTVLAIALGTSIYRYSFMVGRFKIELPDLVKRGLEYPAYWRYGRGNHSLEFLPQGTQRIVLCLLADYRGH